MICFLKKRMALSNSEIKSELGKNILIYPFNESHLSTSSYDVTLGENFFLECEPQKTCENGNITVQERLNSDKINFFNPFDEKSVKKVWGEPQKALSLREVVEKFNFEISLEEDFANISPEEKVILISPGSTILAHTNEYIGGMNNITTMMKARSSYGRSFIEVCKCAGWGDVGYTNRWTMEITNISKYHTIPLVVGRKIAQIVFIRTGNIEGNSYAVEGKYQNTEDFDKISNSWNASSMTPRLFLDKKVCSKEQ